MLYARQNWRDTRFFLVLLVVGYIGFGVFLSVQHHSLQAGGTFIISASLPLLLMPALYLYSRLSYVELDETEIRIHLSLRRASIPYTEVEKARLDTLRNIFERPQYRKMATGTVKRLYSRRALCVKIRDPEALERLRRRLGPRTVMENEVVLAVADVEDAYGTLKQGLQARRQRSRPEGAAAGGARRGRRGRLSR